MIKRETFALLKMVSGFYEQFAVDQEKVNLWHEVLKGYAFADVQQNLFSYAAQSPYPPKVSELVQTSTNFKAVPNRAETKIMMTKNIVPASKEVVQRELAKMREILGIVRC